MNYTENYQLCQWEASDPIRREDFNADNAVIDAALGALTAGQVHTALGTYTGTGDYGADTPNTLTFDFEPQMVIIMCEDRLGVFLRGNTRGLVSYFAPSTYKDVLSVTWSGKTMNWYILKSYGAEVTYSSVSAGGQLNVANRTYHYFALG